MVPVRRPPVYFGTVYVNWPLSVPLAGSGAAIQAVLLFACQLQPVGTVTFTVPVPPAPEKVLLLGDMVQLHSVVALDVPE